MKPSSLSCCLSVLLTICVCATTHCQEKATADYAPLKYIPEAVVGFVHVNVRATLSAPMFKYSPIEVLSAAGLENIGIDPMLIESVDVAIGGPGPAGVEFGAVVTLSKPFRVTDLNPDVINKQNPTDVKGKKFYSSPAGPIVFHQVNDKVILVGTMSQVQLMALATGEQSRLIQFAAKANLSQTNVVILVDTLTLRPLIQGSLQSVELPNEAAAAVNSVVAGTDVLAIRASLESEALQVLFQSANESASQKVEAAINELEAFGIRLAMQQAASINASGSAVDKASIAYLQRMTKEALAELKPKRSKDRVVVQASLKDKMAWMTTGVMAGVLLPAVQGARDAARRTQSMNNLKQIGLAMMIYEDANHVLPGNIVDKATGKPLLSWRVAILPYLEQQSLYDQFHLDEPWDSDHNRKLLERMPATFKRPGANTQEGETVYLAPAGDGIGIAGRKLASISDGASNTVMVLDAPSTAAAPWTAPQDISIKQDDPLAPWNEAGAAKLEALMTDGSVQALNLIGTAPSSFFRMLTPDAQD